eukprot:COSAG01_NODE_49_length_31891_cov_29.945773_30_plen_130_part_00
MTHASNTQSPTPRAPCWCWRFVTLYFIFEADGLSATRRRPPPTTPASFAESRALGHHRWNHGRAAPARTGSAAACAAELAQALVDDIEGADVVKLANILYVIGADKWDIDDAMATEAPEVTIDNLGRSI